MYIYNNLSQHMVVQNQFVYKGKLNCWVCGVQVQYHMFCKYLLNVLINLGEQNQTLFIQGVCRLSLSFIKGRKQK